MKAPRSKFLPVLWAAIAGVALFYQPCAWAELFRWVDDQGEIHFTDDLTQVPIEHRRKAKEESDKKQPVGEDRVNVIKSTGGNNAPAAEDVKKAPPSDDSQARQEKLAQQYRDRAERSRDQINAHKQELETLYQEKQKNLYSGPGMQGRSEGFAQREAYLKKEIARLEKYLAEDLPEEARRAGLPPGALR